jgi:hypothetical protein
MIGGASVPASRTRIYFNATPLAREREAQRTQMDNVGQRVPPVSNEKSLCQLFHPTAGGDVGEQDFIGEGGDEFISAGSECHPNARASAPGNWRRWH